ncbi:MAG TPA: carbohydrate ABC transporter permease [Candidatus Limnocylindrales bacterium]|nr:carbohydrate ABC transporter permease [Candidatus Limnocylindrales bacterium]
MIGGRLSAASGRGRRRALARVALYACLIGVGLFMVFPFAWMAVSSLKPFSEIFAGRTFLPAAPTLDNYASLFGRYDVLGAVWNSTFIAVFFTVLSTLLCALAGYAFAKFTFPGRRWMFAFILATLAIPFAVLLVPLFILMRNVLHWIDTPWPLIVPWAANAFGIFFMRQYLTDLPDEMLDSARVDGASELRIFAGIVLPTSLPGLASLATIFFIGRWNDFLWPLAVLQAPDNYTLPLLLNSLRGAPGRTAYDLLMAGSVISLLPMLVLFLVFQRWVVAGATTGAVKG